MKWIEKFIYLLYFTDRKTKCDKTNTKKIK